MSSDASDIEEHLRAASDAIFSAGRVEPAGAAQAADLAGRGSLRRDLLGPSVSWPRHSRSSRSTRKPGRSRRPTVGPDLETIEELDNTPALATILQRWRAIERQLDSAEPGRQRLRACSPSSSASATSTWPPSERGTPPIRTDRECVGSCSNPAMGDSRPRSDGPRCRRKTARSTEFSRSSTSRNAIDGFPRLRHDRQDRSRYQSRAAPVTRSQRRSRVGRGRTSARRSARGRRRPRPTRHCRASE